MAFSTTSGMCQTVLFSVSQALQKQHQTGPLAAGVYAVDLDKFGKVQCVATADTAQISTSLGLAWNTGTGGQSYLYAASGAQISAYRPIL